MGFAKNFGTIEIERCTMAGIFSISGISGVGGAGGIRPMQAPGLNKPQNKKTPGFGDVMKAYVDNVDAKQKTAAGAMQDLVAGKTNDVLPAVNQIAKADLSFKLLMGVRNKVIEAYKETMRMQV